MGAICSGKRRFKRQPTMMTSSLEKSTFSHRTILGRIHDAYTFNKVLGYGHYGVVRSATKINGN